MILKRGQGKGQGAGCADDVKLHEHFLRSSLRTRDPDAATLFFVPVYLGRLFNWFWQRPHCDEEDAPEPPMCRSEQVQSVFVPLHRTGSHMAEFAGLRGTHPGVHSLQCMVVFCVRH